MRISNRVKSLISSPIRKLTPYADATRASGKKIYALNIGQPDIETPHEFMDAIRSFEQKVIAYGPSKGNPNLIAAISKYYKDWNMDYEAKDIYITNGGSEALLFSLSATCDPGDELIVFEPYYPNYSMFATELGIKVVPISLNADNGYRLPPEEEIEKAVTSRTRAILVTNPSNPTGAVYTKEEMERLARISLKHDLALLSDEVYREFVYDGAYVSFGTMPALKENLILIDSVSKRYSACGARVGCVICKNPVFQANMLKCCQSRLCSPTLEQVGAAALYTTPKSVLEAVKAEYIKRRDTIEAELAKLPGVKASTPQGAFYVMVTFPVDDSEKFAIWLLEHFDIDGETVMFAPGNGFYQDPEKGKKGARLAYVLNCDNIKKAIHILGEGLKAYPGRDK